MIKTLRTTSTVRLCVLHHVYVHYKWPYIYMCRVQQMFQNSTCQAGQVCLPCRYFHLPRHSHKQYWVKCKDSVQNNTCRAGQVRVLFCLPDCRFWPNFLATWQAVMLHADVLCYSAKRSENKAPLALKRVVANLAKTNWCKRNQKERPKPWHMGTHLSESTEWELSS